MKHSQFPIQSNSNTFKNQQQQIVLDEGLPGKASISGVLSGCAADVNKGFLQPLQSACGLLGLFGVGEEAIEGGVSLCCCGRSLAAAMAAPQISASPQSQTRLLAGIHVMSHAMPCRYP